MSLKKQITISPDLLKYSSSSSIKEKKQTPTKIKMNKPSKLKKEFLKRIKNYRDNSESKSENNEVDVAFSSDFQESMKYLMDVMKNKPSNNKTVKRKIKRDNVPNVNVSLPSSLKNDNMQIIENKVNNFPKFKLL